MAATRLIALHAGAGSIESVLRRSADYIENGGKTRGGELVLSHECDPLTAPQEFALAKRQYAVKTGRDQGGRDVIGYHLRQSFKPGEIDAETAGKVAWDTAMALTKGRHAFVVAVHVDKAHIHSHTVFNSTSLDCSRKFRNFKRSGLALQKISDTICLSRGLSVIESPRGKGRSYDKWLGNAKPLGNREQLAFAIDSVLPKCKSWEGFIAELKSLGCEARLGARAAVRLPGARRFARLSSLPAGYREGDLRARLSGEMKFEPKPLRETNAKAPRLLIDIQAKMREGYGKGFGQWAKVENVKRMAKTLIYVQESGIDSYEELERKCSDACGGAAAVRRRIRELEIRQGEINGLQKQIGTYGKTLSAYSAYKRSGWDKDFFEANRADIVLHKAAKKYFGEHGSAKNGKLPSISQLREQWAELEKQKRPLYSEYKAANQKFKDLCSAKSNAARMLGVEQNRERPRRSELEI
ncbi:MAG: relaxase/mobilization nuclease domain-containing protein [Clostridiales bacterium]|jgi:hypothetical protein|nr:relaxase/mobilization nuclease domain-containing protein [Clostridiales bacterium]